MLSLLSHYLIRNYLKKARLHFRSIQTERGQNRSHLLSFVKSDAVCVNILSLHLLLFSHSKKTVMSFRWLFLLLFIHSFSFVMTVCTVLCSLRFDWEHGKTEAAFLYRLFSQHTDWLLITGKAQDQLMTVPLDLLVSPLTQQAWMVSGPSWL